MCLVVTCCNLITSYQHSTLLYTILVYTACDASQLHLHPSVVSSPACESAQSMVLWHMKGVLAGHLAGEAEPKKTQYNFILQKYSKYFKNLILQKRFLSENICAFRILFGSELADRMRPPWATQQAWSFSLQ